MAGKKTVLVTGATTGIGREIALHLARLGHRVFATGRNEGALESLVEESGDKALETFRLDVNDPQSITSARAEVDEKTEGYGVDVLVNNAGFGNMAPIEMVSDADMRGQFETNVFGLVKVSQAFMPAMRKRGSGKIIQISSVVGRLTLPLQGVYCATKHAVESISDALRMEAAPFGVHVSIVEPGTIRSRFEEKVTSTISSYKTPDSPYSPAIGKYRETVGKAYKKAASPACIARTVAKIVRKRRPKARYVSPWFNKLAIFFARLVPTRWFDFGMRKAMGLDKKLLDKPGE